MKLARVKIEENLACFRRMRERLLGEVQAVIRRGWVRYRDRKRLREREEEEKRAKEGRLRGGGWNWNKS